MNTTTTAHDPGYYTPTPADCEEAGLNVGLNGMEEPIASWQVGSQVDDDTFRVIGDRIVFHDNGTATLESAADESQDRELVFGDRDKCMAFLRNHIVTAAEPTVAVDVAPTLVKDGEYVGRIVISSSIEESNLPAEEFQRMWDSAAANHSGGLARMFTPKKDEGGAE